MQVVHDIMVAAAVSGWLVNLSRGFGVDETPENLWSAHKCQEVAKLVSVATNMAELPSLIVLSS